MDRIIKITIIINIKSPAIGTLVVMEPDSIFTNTNDYRVIRLLKAYYCCLWHRYALQSHWNNVSLTVNQWYHSSRLTLKQFPHIYWFILNQIVCFVYWQRDVTSSLQIEDIPSEIRPKRLPLQEWFRVCCKNIPWVRIHLRKEPIFIAIVRCQ